MIRKKEKSDRVNTITKSFSLNLDTWEYIRFFAEDNGITYSAAVDILIRRGADAGK